mgnify:CR=1 FL=1
MSAKSQEEVVGLDSNKIKVLLDIVEKGDIGALSAIMPAVQLKSRFLATCDSDGIQKDS